MGVKRRESTILPGTVKDNLTELVIKEEDSSKRNLAS
jgi:hypothetical protein